MRTTRAIGLAAGAAAVGAAALAGGALAWRRATAAAVADLDATAGRRPDAPVQQPATAPLPPPVARYLARAIPPDAAPIRTARIEWRGEFQMRPDGGWRPFEAVQHFTIHPPGFVWDARIHLLPLVTVRVRDALVAGRGSMLGRVGGLVPVVDRAGSPGMASSALARWLGEAAWFPTALRPGAGPGSGVQWTAIDDRTARATISHGEASASAEFHFAPTGEIVRMTALRARDVNGADVPTPFEGTYRDYERRDGLLVPMAAEVAWLLPEGRYPYWRGRPVAVRYDR